MMYLHYTYRECCKDYKLTKSLEKIYRPRYIDDIKVFAEKEKERDTMIQTIRIYSQNRGIEFCIKYVPCS